MRDMALGSFDAVPFTYCTASNAGASFAARPNTAEQIPSKADCILSIERSFMQLALFYLLQQSV